MREIAFCFLVLLSALMTRPCFARGFSTVLPLQIGMSASIEEHHAVTTAKPAAGQWEPAPLPRAMAAPPIRRLTAGKIVDFARQFLPGGGGGAVNHDPTTGTPIGAFGAAYQNASLVGHGLAPPGETVGR